MSDGNERMSRGRRGGVNYDPGRSAILEKGKPAQVVEEPAARECEVLHGDQALELFSRDFPGLSGIGAVIGRVRDKTTRVFGGKTIDEVVDPTTIMGEGARRHDWEVMREEFLYTPEGKRRLASRTRETHHLETGPIAHYGARSTVTWIEPTEEAIDVERLIAAVPDLPAPKKEDDGYWEAHLRRPGLIGLVMAFLGGTSTVQGSLEDISTTKERMGYVLAEEGARRLDRKEE